jgi:hypothetical protein
MTAGLPIYKKVEGRDGDRIVLFSWDRQPPKLCNVVRIAADGRTIWTVDPPHPLEGVYSHVEFKNGTIEAHNMAGYIDTIDYETGKATHKTFVK